LKTTHTHTHTKSRLELYYTCEYKTTEHGKKEKRKKEKKKTSTSTEDVFVEQIGKIRHGIDSQTTKIQSQRNLALNEKDGLTVVVVVVVGRKSNAIG